MSLTVSEPLAVVISDLHFNVNNLDLASYALRKAVRKSEQLMVPLIIAGDLNDSKAIIRAEVANRLISILDSAEYKVFILVGNHDLINEKDSPHGLNYLEPYATIVDKPTTYDYSSLLLLPYYSNTDLLQEDVKKLAFSGIQTVIMHQGVKGAWMGDYVQDKSSIAPEVLKDYTVISGHYHKHQTVGTITYIGSPYTMSFGEANDGPKGFLILNTDGSYTREILNLRKHVIIEATLSEEQVDFQCDLPELNPEDLIWVKLKGPQSELKRINKKTLGQELFGHSNFKLDLIPNDSAPLEVSTEKLTEVDTFDKIIDTLDDTEQHKTQLKRIWREITES